MFGRMISIKELMEAPEPAPETEPEKKTEEPAGSRTIAEDPVRRPASAAAAPPRPPSPPPPTAKPAAGAPATTAASAPAKPVASAPDKAAESSPVRSFFSRLAAPAPPRTEKSAPAPAAKAAESDLSRESLWRAEMAAAAAATPPATVRSAAPVASRPAASTPVTARLVASQPASAKPAVAQPASAKAVAAPGLPVKEKSSRGFFSHLRPASSSARAEDSVVEGEERSSASAPARGLLPKLLSAYRSSLKEMGLSSTEVCPGLGDTLKEEMESLAKALPLEASERDVERTENAVRARLEDWTQKVVQHNQKKTDEVKEILLVMAHTAESVGERDNRCAKQITEVTSRLKAVANLEDLSQMRTAIERSATELKTSIDRMTAEGKEAISKLKNELNAYQSKLEEAETLASRDSLTGLVVRRCVENQIQRRIDAQADFCVAVLDVNGFKQVNDTYGHLAGDELLKQFAGELRSRSRSNDVIGRWGGDEFLILLDLDMEMARAQIDRLREWICGNYTLTGATGPIRLEVSASIGLAEYRKREDMKSLLHRADEEMYREKSARKAGQKTEKP